MLRKIILGFMLFAIISCSSNQKSNSVPDTKTSGKFLGIEVVLDNSLQKNGEEFFKSQNIENFLTFDDSTFLVSVNEDSYQKEFNLLASNNSVKRLTLVMEVIKVEK
jgi:hypothetical protein